VLALYNMESDKLLILAVDDDATIRMLLEFLLKKRYRVVLREDGWDALAWMGEGNLPDLILADLEMPRVDGISLLEQVKASGAFSHIPVVILTGHESQELFQRCKSAGADDYLLKPFNPDVLYHRIDKALAAGVRVG
jgi:CheY-like chemotaxis protein